MKGLKYKKPSDSEVIKMEVVCPNDTNPMGILRGGRLVEWMDIAAAVSAQTHSNKACVTASLNRIDIKRPVSVGDIVDIRARITRAFNTSMEIFVQVFAKKISLGKKRPICEAYFTFVALNEGGKPTRTIAIKPVTASDKKLYSQALIRKNSGDTGEISTRKRSSPDMA